MFRKLLKAFLVLASFAAPAAMAVEAGNLTGFNTGASSLTDTTATLNDAIRVRIPLRLTAYDQLVIKNEAGVRRMTSKALAPTRYNFKATLDRSNHFYLQDWHIETVPEVWDHAKREWTVTVHFSKRYGEGQDLEESLGSMRISGKLDGSGKAYKLMAKAENTFQDKRGQPALKVEINSSLFEEKGNIARRESPAAQ